MQGTNTNTILIVILILIIVAFGGYWYDQHKTAQSDNGSNLALQINLGNAGDDDGARGN